MEYLITRCGVVPQVGVTHRVGGSFSYYYDDDRIANLLRMAQATQLCTKCNTPKARDDFEQEEGRGPATRGSVARATFAPAANVARRRRAPT